MKSRRFDLRFTNTREMTPWDKTQPYRWRHGPFVLDSAYRELTEARDRIREDGTDWITVEIVESKV